MQGEPQELPVTRETQATLVPLAPQVSQDPQGPKAFPVVQVTKVPLVWMEPPVPEDPVGPPVKLVHPALRDTQVSLEHLVPLV